MPSRSLRVLFAASCLLGITSPAFAQTTDDLVGSWASSDRFGNIGNGISIGDSNMPTCNDLWNATRDGTQASQGRGSFKIIREGENWSIAVQQIFSQSTTPAAWRDVAFEPVEVTGSVDAMTLRWASAPREASISISNEGVRILTVESVLGTEYYARCPVAPGQTADAEWVPPEATPDSYIACYFVYSVAASGSSERGNQLQSRFEEEVSEKWNEAAVRISAADSVIEAIQSFGAMVMGMTSEEEAERMLREEYERCGGPPPLILP